MIAERLFAVSLTIPDNEAFTALGALQRLGVACASLERATIWSFRVDDAHADALAATVRHIETIYNPNKHRMTALDHDAPGAGEVWVAPLDDPPERERVTLAGRTLAGVRNVRRRIAWRLRDAAGAPVAEDVLVSAVERLLCNPASERTIR